MHANLWMRIRHRVLGAWDVLLGRAWAGYGNPAQYDFNDDYPGEDRSR